jgi:predicted nucleotidyltransferase
MKRGLAIARLKFKQRGVNRLYLFGSTARDEARDDSDVNLFFDHGRGKLGLFQLMDVKEFAAKVLSCRTEIMTRASLYPVLRERIEASALQVF